MEIDSIKKNVSINNSNYFQPKQNCANDGHLVNGRLLEKVRVFEKKVGSCGRPHARLQSTYEKLVVLTEAWVRGYADSMRTFRDITAESKLCGGNRWFRSYLTWLLFPAELYRPSAITSDYLIFTTVHTSESFDLKLFREWLRSISLLKQGYF